jgi:hypothetical protein
MIDYNYIKVLAKELGRSDTDYPLPDLVPIWTESTTAAHAATRRPLAPVQAKPPAMPPNGSSCETSCQQAWHPGWP